jgi:hypothetical protein
MTFYGSTENQSEMVQLEQARSTAALLRPKLQLDQITTGSIRVPLKKTGARVTAFPSRPPADGENTRSDTIQFITATNNRALAVVDGKLTIFVPGDRLPDGRIIARFEQENGKIVPVANDAIDTQRGAPDPFR